MSYSCSLCFEQKTVFNNSLQLLQRNAASKHFKIVFTKNGLIFGISFLNNDRRVCNIFLYNVFKKLYNRYEEVFHLYIMEYHIHLVAYDVLPKVCFTVNMSYIIIWQYHSIPWYAKLEDLSAIGTSILHI